MTVNIQDAAMAFVRPPGRFPASPRTRLLRSTRRQSPLALLTLLAAICVSHDAGAAPTAQRSALELSAPILSADARLVTIGAGKDKHLREGLRLLVIADGVTVGELWLWRVHEDRAAAGIVRVADGYSIDSSMTAVTPLPIVITELDGENVRLTYDGTAELPPGIDLAVRRNGATVGTVRVTRGSPGQCTGVAMRAPGKMIYPGDVCYALDGTPDRPSPPHAEPSPRLAQAPTDAAPRPAPAPPQSAPEGPRAAAPLRPSGPRSTPPPFPASPESGPPEPASEPQSEPESPSDAAPAPEDAPTYAPVTDTLTTTSKLRRLRPVKIEARRADIVRLDEPERRPGQRNLPGGQAADALFIPTAWSLWGSTGAAGIAGVRHRAALAGSDIDFDPAAIVAYGFGRSESAVEVRAVMGDLSEHDNVAFDLKWHFRNEDNKGPALAVGVENAFGSTSPGYFFDRSAYMVGTKTYWDRQRLRRGRSLFTRTTLTLGFGLGDAFNDSPLGALSTSLTRRSTFILDYDGYGLGAGLSLCTPSPRGSVVMNAGATEVLDADRRTFSAGFTFPLGF